MTEEQAKTKWCSFARIENENGAYNRLYNGGVCSEVLCLGSGCMAWRWDEEFKSTVLGGEDASFHSETGYCGMVSK